MPLPPVPPPPWAVALAAAIVGLAEQAILNPISILRSRALAGRHRRDAWRKVASSWRQWSRGLPLVAATQFWRNALGFGGHAWLSSLGLGGGLAGSVVGALDGAAFTPSRRLSLMQHLGNRHDAVHLARVIVRTEGWRGLWRGWRLNMARTAWGGAAYFGCLQALAAVRPGTHPALAGALATIGCTIAVNPVEVALARFYVGARRKPRQLRVWWRGLVPSLLRSVPGKAVGFWAIQALARALS